MTLDEIQFWAEMTRRFFEENKEFCPHDYHWDGTESDGTTIFKCSVCGEIMVKEGEE